MSNRPKLYMLASRSLDELRTVINNIRHASDDEFVDQDGEYPRPTESELCLAERLGEIIIRGCNHEIEVDVDVLGGIAIYIPTHSTPLLHISVRSGRAYTVHAYSNTDPWDADYFCTYKIAEAAIATLSQPVQNNPVA